MKLRHFVIPGCVVLVCLWTSCGRSSVSSAVASSYESDTAPALETVEEGLKVRPDVLLLSFAFRQETESLEQAVPKLKAAVERYVRAAAEASKAEVAVKMKEVSLASGRKMAGTDAMAHGVLEVSLPESQDFWGRSALVATLVQVGSQEAAAAEKENTGLRATFGFPEARVRDPERQRAELMNRWVERARGFISQAQTERAPLQLAGCEPPGAVKQETVSVDEVVLSLAVSCRLDAVAK
ncbi:hypothetical protein ACN28I_34525 [Archangium gephyra]|uniref:hypothetical protein n=1 Tax=Archangium gephyra TaxID=48 RepID=UPI003B7F39F4